jgi:predicted nucleotidyltransferase
MDALVDASAIAAARDADAASAVEAWEALALVEAELSAFAAA